MSVQTTSQVAQIAHLCACEEITIYKLADKGVMLQKDFRTSGAEICFVSSQDSVTTGDRIWEVISATDFLISDEDFLSPTASSK